MQQQTNTCAQLPRTEQIARLNDNLRKTGSGGMIVITRGVKHLSGFDAEMLAETLAVYDEFDADGDPHGERDFGTLTLFGADTIWKVDYYDAAMEFVSDDPANPNVTNRVLTVMLAQEW